ncbi:MAG: hypothetical protein ACHQUC_03155 [Chlamydiales bacterium]
MAAKKGEIPAHVKKKEFSHPNTQHPVILILGGVEEMLFQKKHPSRGGNRH